MNKILIKPKKCKVCGEMFTPWNSFHQACKPACAIELINANKRKASKRQLREGREKLKTKSDYVKECQKQCNRYIRARDNGNVCISCQKPPKKINAGHFLSTASHPELRFNENNIWLQCEHCNSYLSGNQALYRINLIKKIGLKEVERLEGPHKPAKWTIDELKAMKKDFSSRALELEKSNKL